MTERGNRTQGKLLKRRYIRKLKVFQPSDQICQEKRGFLFFFHSFYSSYFSFRRIIIFRLYIYIPKWKSKIFAFLFREKNQVPNGEKIKFIYIIILYYYLYIFKFKKSTYSPMGIRTPDFRYNSALTITAKL